MSVSNNHKKSSFDKTIEIALASMLIIMTIIIFLQIIFRYLLGASLAWSEELARGLQIWLSYLGAAYAVKKASHIGMTDIVERFPPKLRRFFYYLSDVAIVGFCVFLVYQGFKISNTISYQTMPMLGIKMSYIYAALPIGALISIYFVIEKYINKASKKENA